MEKNNNNDQKQGGTTTLMADVDFVDVLKFDCQDVYAECEDDAENDIDVKQVLDRTYC